MEDERNILNLSEQITALAVQPGGHSRVESPSLVINFNVGDHNTLTVNEPVTFIQSLPPRIEGFGINIHFTHGLQNEAEPSAGAELDAELNEAMANFNVQNVPDPVIQQGVFHPGIGYLLPYAQGPHENVTIQRDDGELPYYCSMAQANAFIMNHSLTSRLTDSMVLFILRYNNLHVVPFQTGSPDSGFFKYPADDFLYRKDGHKYFNRRDSLTRPEGYYWKFDCAANPAFVDGGHLPRYIVRRRYRFRAPNTPHCFYHYLLHGSAKENEEISVFPLLSVLL